MTEAILFGDVEQMQIDWLTATLPNHGYTGIKVSSQVDKSNPSVRVLGTGGQQRNLVVGTPTLVWEAWHKTETGASLLARTMRALIGALPGQTVGGMFIYSADLDIPQNFPDPESSRVRYTFAGSLSIRGYALQ
jgi:hypothetical protein